MEAYLRSWMNDALGKHQYDSAIYVGDKLLALTHSDSDAYALSLAHFSASNYTRALAFVSRADLIHRSAAAKYLAANCYIKQSRHEDALALLGEKNPVHLIAGGADNARRKLQHLHGAVNGVGGGSKPALGPGKGKGIGRGERADRSEEREMGRRDDLKYEGGMCYLRGLCYAKQNAFDRAKECYKDAVRIDVQCFEAFDQLMKNSLMSPGEEWDFLDSLDFESIQPAISPTVGAGPETASQQSIQEAAHFTRTLYTTRLSKYSRPEEFTTALETLSTHYHLSSNPDILLSKAELLSTTSQHAPALALTTAILDADPYNFTAIPLHLSLLYQLSHTNALFALSHDLADTHPGEPATWLAVGTYYLATSRIPEARSYFSKASLMDPHFGPAWIGFAHTFAAEGEGDQAIAAYSTAARLFQGTHLPQLFLGMQELSLDNLAIAREYLTTAYQLCDRDPLLINEIGVCCYKEGDYDSAIRHFALALRIREDCEAPAAEARDTRLNLAQALRRAGRFHESLEQFDEVIRLGERECGVFASKGLVLLELEQPFEATVTLHEGLAISPQDPLASELLAKALSQLEGVSCLGSADEEAVDMGLRGKLAEVRQTRGKGRRRRGRDDKEAEMDLDGLRES